MELNETQVDKFKALGKAARKMAGQFKNGEGPNPTSGSTYRGGVPQCTWGQLLDQAGFKPGKNFNESDNTGAFADFIGVDRHKIQANKKAVGSQTGFFVDQEINFDLDKIKNIGRQIMQANDPQGTAEARKKHTWTHLEALADEIDEVFGKVTDEVINFETAAEQYLDDLVLSEVKISFDID